MELPSNNNSINLTKWNKVFKRISIIVGIGFLVNLAIVAFMSESFDPKILFSFHPAYLLLAFICGVVPIYLHAYTLKLWGICFEKKLDFKDSIHISAASLLGSAITPTMIGGSPLKLGLLMMNGFRMGEAAAIVTIGNIQDFIGFMLLVISSIYLSKTVDLSIIKQKIFSLSFSPNQYILLILAIITLIIIVKYFVKKSKLGAKINHTIRRTFIDFKSSYQLIISSGKTYFLITTLINVLRWMFIFLILMLLVAGLSITDKLDYKEIWSLQWIVFSGMTFTPLPGGAGGAEATFYFVYKSFFPSDTIVVLILVWRFFESYFRLILAAILVVFFSKSKKVTY